MLRMLPDIWEISRESAGKIDDTLYASYYPVAMTVIDSYMGMDIICCYHVTVCVCYTGIIYVSILYLC